MSQNYSKGSDNSANSGNFWTDLLILANLDLVTSTSWSKSDENLEFLHKNIRRYMQYTVICSKKYVLTLSSCKQKVLDLS